MKVCDLTVKSGSSPNSGEGGPDPEEEVGVVAEAVGHPRDHLDLVVDTFDQVGTERSPAVGEDAGQVRPQVPGEPTLDELAGWPIGAQFVRSIDPYAIDHLAAVLGDDVEQVEDDRGVGTVALRGVAVGLLDRELVHRDDAFPASEPGHRWPWATVALLPLMPRQHQVSSGVRKPAQLPRRSATNR